ncbi:hypothetical protein JET14_22005 (plasmid) [Martelella lutilitoris]|uniref:DUF3108 domain-containing protein n=1 Tax=Martelella lutilitoris TaxID=2583532 RepID=A0A7T7HPV2_9HYPH|nr:hypothetical protein [Martelella lutilitoris]QQM33127.1 hypothetical protein JET14_22005 [Martelella lutilitoris]QRX65278.1 hypothetical protein JS578_14690 [Dysgonomonadaceae bacterium zrk40]
MKYTKENQSATPIRQSTGPAWFCLAFLAVVAFADTAPAEDTPLDCSVYRQGRLKTVDIAIARPEYWEDRTAYDMVSVRYRPEYNPAPWLPSGSPDDPTRWTLLAEINYETGQPVTRKERDETHSWTRPSFRMLLDGRPLPPARTLDILAGRSIADRDPGHVENGTFVYTPGPFERTGEDFHGFERINVLNVQGIRTRKNDFYILKDEQAGAVNSVLKCGKVDAYPNSQCSLYMNSGLLNQTIDFDRDKMTEITRIIHHARNYTLCLTE